MLLSEDVGQDGMTGLLHITKKLTLYTFAIEIVGGDNLYDSAISLYWTGCIIYRYHASYFHLCNAGFVFFDNDLPYAMVGDILFNINTAVLIVIGGFGYLAAFDIWSHRKVRRIC